MFNIKGLWSRFNNKCIGHDEYDNKYFESKKTDYLGKKARYVVYKDAADPSTIPPVFHAWLHHLSNEIPKSARGFTWQKNHMPNLTGTELRYSPCTLGNKRSRISSDYQSWKP